MDLPSTLTIHSPLVDKSGACEAILRALPEWFGIEEANLQYLKDIDALPTFLAQVNDCLVGFLTVKQHTIYAAEIYVMGVLPAYHRMGIGRALVKGAETHMREQGIEYLQVKTLSPKHADQGYAKTRLFYQAMGFRPLEEFPTLWDADNPCLQMIKFLQKR
jgi:GNAT superfamily N-acetyltransferase